MYVRKMFGRRILGSIAAAALSTAAVIGVTAARAGAAPFKPARDGDPFYAAPADLTSASNGQVLKVQSVPSPFPGSTAQKIQFRSTNSQGEPIAAVTTVLVPDGGTLHNLLSYQPFTNSLELQSAPSHQLFKGDLQEQQLIGLALANGTAVNVPDHLGPTSAYAAVLAPSYAPELNLVGLSAGGTPVNLEAIARTLGVIPILPGDHGSTISIGVPFALNHIDDRLSGAPAPSTC